MLRRTQPPESRISYVIPQLEGECITIPGSKGAFRILASSKQTNGTMSVFQSGAVLSDAPGFHYHDNAHDIFIVTKGFLKLWNGDKCRILGPGDFASVPPLIVHNPQLLGPHTETIGLVTPGDWVDFFRYVSEPFNGLIVPEDDDRDLKELLIPKLMEVKDKFDVVFQPDYKPPEVGDWDKSDEHLPDSAQPYFLRANTGPRWIAGGIISRPFITTAQSNDLFAISSIESSKAYGKSILSNYLTFPTVDHCLCVMEGAIIVRVKGSTDQTVRAGETVVLPGGQGFSLNFESKYVRVWSFTSGDGIETLVHRLGAPFEGQVLPDRARALDGSRFEQICAEMGVQVDMELGQN